MKVLSSHLLMTWRKRALLSCLFVLLCLSSLVGPGWSQSSAREHAAPELVAERDWPQLQRDPQRSGHTPIEVDPPFTYVWKWNAVPFADRTQPVVADGRLFIGGLDGVMYARDAQTGAPVWSFATDGPIRHSAGFYKGRVVFGSYDGTITALRASDGQLAWRYRTGGGIATAPLLANDTVYIGSTDGVFYALNTLNGQVRWRTDLGAPILTTAALSEDQGTVYVGAEDVAAYALSAEDGRVRWRTPLRGQSLRDRWPVVVKDLVIFRSQPLRHFHDLLHEGDDVMDRAGAVDPDWDADWARVRPEIEQFLSENPDRQTFFALDKDSGAAQGPVPMLYTFGNQDVPGPPVVREDEVYTLFRARHGIQQDNGSVHVTTRYDAALGRMDPETLDFSNLKLASGEGWSVEYRATSDEPAMLSMAGSMLFVDNWTRLGGIDVDTGELFEVANVVDEWPACNVECVARAGPMPFFDSYPFPGPRVGEGDTHRPTVIADGMIYWRLMEGALAAIGHADATGSQSPRVWNDAASSPSEPWVRPEGENQALSDYVWTEPTRPVPNPPTDLVSRLEEEIQAILDAGHLAPFLIQRGFTTGQGIPGDSQHPQDGLVKFYERDGNVYWYDPGSLIYSLSLAYPYVSPSLQHELRDYLQAEMERYPPLESLPWPPDWLMDGTRREPYAVPYQPTVWPPPAPPLSTLYALWTYADVTGDWAYLMEHWDGIDALFEENRDQIDSYRDISGAIGYARIARRLGREMDAQEGASVAVSGMEAGMDFSAFVNTANERYPDPRGYETGLRAPVFFGLVPEVGQYIADTNGVAALNYLDRLTDEYDGQYMWYVTKLAIQEEEGETSYHGPDLAWSIFLAQTYVEGKPRSILRSVLDRPWSVGDLYYLQKLVATIEAQSPFDLSSSTKTASTIFPDADQTITYTVSLRNSGDPFTGTVSLTDPLPAPLTLVPGSAWASDGELTVEEGEIRWTGDFSSTSTVTLRYATHIDPDLPPSVVTNEARIDTGSRGSFNASETIYVGWNEVYLPLVLRE